MNQLANVGDFCANEACQDYGKLQEKQIKRNIKKYGYTKKGVQRYQCLTCKETFTEVKTARIAGGLLRPYKGLLLAAPQGAAFTSFKPDAPIT